MDGPALLEACGDRAHHWADAFCQIAKHRHGLDIDYGWMVGWFANAIEHSEIVRERREMAQMHAEQQAIHKAWAAKVEADAAAIDEGYRRAQAEKDRAGRTDSGDMM